MLLKPLRRDLPPLGLGLASVVLGTIGLMLFVLPILAIPISGCGMIAGIVAAAIATMTNSIDLRLSLLGIVLSCVALSVDTAIAYAPGGYFVRPAEPASSSPALPRPFIPPPAPQQGYFGPNFERYLV